MVTLLVAGTDGARATDQAQSGLEELRVDALRLVALLVVGLALAVFTLATERERPVTWVPVVVLGLLGLVVYQLSGRAPVLARLALIAGLVSTLTGYLYIYPDSSVADAYSSIVVLAAILLGWRSGLATATAISLILLAVGGSGGGPLPGPATSFAVSLAWASALLSWLALRPVYTALDWSWSSYQHAMRKTEELRERQGELNRALRELDRACLQLERANEELARAREAAEEAGRLKTEFATSISHELRTPINLIIGFSEMMVLAPKRSYRESLPESYRGDIEAIYRNAYHVSNLVDDVLDLAQVDAHRMALHREQASLAQIVEEATAAVSRLFRDKRLTLSVGLPPDLPPLYVDRTRVRQIIINLLNNAARFTEEGGVTLTARCDDSDLVIAVADTGPGIAPEDLRYVFQEFRQFGRAEGLRYRGSGLGLAVSKRFAELHGGSMWVESQLDVGTTFYVGLPRCDNVASTTFSRDLTSLVAAHQSSSERTVLLVDERRQAVRIFERYLDGYTVVAVEDVEQARRLVRTTRMHALAVANTLRRSRLVTLLTDARRDLPIVFYSLHLPDEANQEQGVAEHLVKPVTREQLRSALQRLGTTARTVLIVDDDPEMVRLLTRMVRSLCRGCTVFKAYSGPEGLRLLRDHHPDVLLLDILMPEMDGYAVLHVVRADPALRDVKTIVISAVGHAEESVVIQELSITRPRGLTVGEAMRCVQGSLNTLLEAGYSAPAQPAALAG